MRRTAQWKSTRNQIEIFVFLVAMLPAIALKGACVYRLRSAEVKPSPAEIQLPNFVGKRTAATLPQCRLLRALFVLFYRVSAMVVLPPSWGRVEAQSNRRAFLCLWCWTVALGTLQVGALYMDHFTMGGH